MSSSATPTTSFAAGTAPSTAATAKAPLPLPLPPPPPKQTPLPPPQTFDVLPPLHALLSRLDPTLNTYTPEALDVTISSSSSNNNNNNSPPTSTASTNNNNTNNTSASSAGQPQQIQIPQTTTIDFKTLPSTTQFLRMRIRKAVAELGKLDDMDRGVEEQELEIAMLERRIEEQKRVLGRLGVLAGREVGEGVGG